MGTKKPPTSGNLRCSFCNRHEDDVQKLIAGPEVFICDECVGTCNDILADDRLRKVLGLSRMSFHGVDHPIAITDVPLEAEAPATPSQDVAVDNFSFAPAKATVPVGGTITWTNHDDVPHNVVSAEQKFKSPVLDTGEKFSHRFEARGTYKYFCSLHPRMTAQVEVG